MAGKYFNYMESDVDRVNDTHDSYIGRYEHYAPCKM